MNLKEYVSVKGNLLNKVPELIQENLKKAWRLHTYQATGWANWQWALIITCLLKKYLTTKSRYQELNIQSTYNIRIENQPALLEL
jgi:hypothetical protein